MFREAPDTSEYNQHTALFMLLTAAPGGFFIPDSLSSCLATAGLFHVFSGGYYEGLFLCS